MPTLTKEFVIEHLSYFCAKQKEFLAEVRENPETVQDRIWQIEELREMTVKVDLGVDYLAIVDEFLFELSAIKTKYENNDFGPECSGTLQ